LKVLVTDVIHPEAIAWLQSQHEVAYRPDLANDSAGVQAAVTEARVLVVGSQLKVGKAMLKAGSKLQLIARTGPATDNIDVLACAEKNIQVLSTQQPQAQSNCEFLLGALIVQLRGLPTYISRPTHKTADYTGRELNGKTVGLVGLSITGRAMAALLQSFGVKVIGCDPTRNQVDARWERLNIEAKTINEVFAQSDAVCVQLEYGNAYSNFIDSRVIACASPGLVIVSISRSSVFDIAALAQALQSGRIAGAWLDTVESVHMQSDSPLRGLENLTITPRLAGRTVEAQMRVSWQLVKRIDEFLTSFPMGTVAHQNVPRGFNDSRPGDSRPHDSRPFDDSAPRSNLAGATAALELASQRMAVNPLLQGGVVMGPAHEGTQRFVRPNELSGDLGSPDSPVKANVPAPYLPNVSSTNITAEPQKSPDASNPLMQSGRG
jgi:phosphoglycerate dehydrogenase-like enzyme